MFLERSKQLIVLFFLLNIQQGNFLNSTRTQVPLRHNASKYRDRIGSRFFLLTANLNLNSDSINSSVSSNVPSNTYKSFPEYEQDSWFGMEGGVLIDLLIFVCCAAGVFGVFSLCCVVCSKCCLSPDVSVRVNRHRSSPSNFLVWECRRQNQLYLQQTHNETIIAFIPHHQPSAEGKSDNDEINDLPPSYENLDQLKDDAPCSSPPPPPYTPSFDLPNVCKSEI